MKCGYCGNDLMLGIVPKGPARLLRLLPMTAYRCVRCGGLNWRLSEAYGAVGSRLALMVLLLAALGLSYWLGATYGLPGQGANAVRREVAMALGQPPRAALPQPAPVATPPVQTTPETAAPETAAPETAAPAPSAQPAPDTAPAPGPSVAQESPASRAEAETSPQAAPEPAPRAEPTPAPAPPASKDLDEVVVTPPAPAPREKPVVVAANKAAKGPSSKWAMRLVDVRASAKDGVATVTIRANATQDAPKAFALKSPPRYVLDLPGTWAVDSVRTLAAKGGIVKSVRLGMRDDALRVVLDLARLPAAEPTVAVAGETVTITLR